MKIDNSPKVPGSLQTTAGNRAAGAAAPAKPAAASRSPADASSTVMGTMLHKVADTEAPFNAEKVAEIRQAIAEGRFQINPERIAEGLIDNVRDMLARDRKTA